MEIILTWHWWYLPLAVFLFGIFSCVTHSPRSMFDFNLTPIFTTIAAIALVIGHFV